MAAEAKKEGVRAIIRQMQVEIRFFKPSSAYIHDTRVLFVHGAAITAVMEGTHNSLYILVHASHNSFVLRKVTACDQEKRLSVSVGLNN